MGGVIAIAVKTDGGKIVSIRVLNQHETPGIGGKAIATLPNEAVANNGKIDNVSGASVTSNGFRTSLADAPSK